MASQRNSEVELVKHSILPREVLRQPRRERKIGQARPSPSPTTVVASAADLGFYCLSRLAMKPIVVRLRCLNGQAQPAPSAVLDESTHVPSNEETSLATFLGFSLPRLKGFSMPHRNQIWIRRTHYL